MTETLDPERLEAFRNELTAGGFEALDADGNCFVGPLPSSLEPFTGTRNMFIALRWPWPYQQPLVWVEGIDWWHSTDGTLCLWQRGDNTKRWITLAGILARVDEWAALAANDFETPDGAALDPELYFNVDVVDLVGLDIDGLIGSLRQDGQHARVHILRRGGGLQIVESGRGPDDAIWGHWFFRSGRQSPPRDGDDLESRLTDKQRHRLDQTLRLRRKAVVLLAWPTPHGTACLPLLVTQATDGPRTYHRYLSTPISRADRLRRAGPDAVALQTRTVAIFGLGAIGSHTAKLLTQSGIKVLRGIDGDVKTPAGLVRHAFPGVNVGKASEARDALAIYDWTTVEPVETSSWDLPDLYARCEGADLCIDATGDSLFAELLSRVTLDAATPFLSVALYRGGRVLRVRRQATPADTPLLSRPGRWGYPRIPVGPDPADDFVGVETGCTAPIHNAPPTSVATAAALATRVAIDFLAGRLDYPDELIEVLQPIEAPFDHIGVVRPEPPPVLLAESARTTLTAAASATHPAETGGILVGARDNSGAICIVEAVEFRPADPSTERFEVPDGVTHAAVDALREADPRLEYVGEWHSHPSDHPASAIDAATMRALAKDPSTGNPALLVVRPRSADGPPFAIHAYAAVGQSLVEAPLIDCGPLPPPQDSASREDE